MSKAFKRGDGGDDGDDGAPDDVDEAQAAAIPGGKNYITPAGAARLRAEFRRLKYDERPEVTKTVTWAAGNGDRSENGDYLYGKKRLREIDKRLRFLAKRLEMAEVVDPLLVQSTAVQFGATVTVRYEDGRDRCFSIVGVDEVDVERGRISWQSPLARALLKAQAGDVVLFRAPGGMQELELIAVEYRALE